METGAFDKEQIDGIAGGPRADIETKYNTKSAIRGGIAGEHVTTIEPHAVTQRRPDQCP